MPYEFGNSNIKVTNADTDDSVRLREIALEANIDAWTAADYSEEIGRIDSIVLKAESSNGEILGFLVARIVPSNSAGQDAELYNIAVRPALQRSGVGGLLIADLFQRLRIDEVTAFGSRSVQVIRTRSISIRNMVSRTSQFGGISIQIQRKMLSQWALRFRRFRLLLRCKNA